MSHADAHAALSSARRIVIKIGSALVSHNGEARQDWLDRLAADMAALQSEGRDLVLVTVTASRQVPEIVSVLPGAARLRAACRLCPLSQRTADACRCESAAPVAPARPGNPARTRGSMTLMKMRLRSAAWSIWAMSVGIAST